jgi:cation transport ATPase
VNLALGKATVEGNTDPTKLIEAVKATGYGVSLVDPREKEATEDLSLKVEQEISRARKKVVIAWGLTIPAMIWMLVEMALVMPGPQKTYSIWG